MMSYRTIIFVFAISLLTFSSARSELFFIYPKENSWVDRQGHLVLRFSDLDATAIRISVNGVASDRIDIGSPEYRKLFQNYFIAQSLWDEGKNTVTAELFKGGQKTETVSTTIFYVLGSTKSKAPPEYSPNTMHVDSLERLCVPCHNMSPTRKQSNSTVGKENPCYLCHKKIVSSKYVHGPTGSYTCGFCHSGKEGSKYAVTRRQAELCYECHGEMGVQLKKRKFMHGPVEAGLCEACHDSHGTPHESQLHKAINDLCLSCHGHVSAKAHVTRDAMGGSHPLSGRPDPLKLKSGKKLTCISCHNPHGGNVRFYLVNDPGSRQAFCQMCHNK